MYELRHLPNSTLVEIEKILLQQCHSVLYISILLHTKVTVVYPQKLCLTLLLKTNNLCRSSLHSILLKSGCGNNLVYKRTCS